MSAQTAELPQPQGQPQGQPVPTRRQRVQRELRSWLWTLLLMAAVWMAVQSLRGGTQVTGIAPDFEVVDTSGNRLRLSELRGRPTVLYFWASWCNACKLTSPQVDAFSRDHPEITVIGMASDEPEDLRGYLAETPRSFRTALLTTQVARTYSISALPTTIVLDATGTVVWSRQGLMMPWELAWHVP